MQATDSPQIFTDADLFELFGISSERSRSRKSNQEPIQNKKVLQGKIEFVIGVCKQTGWVNVSMIAIPAPRPRATLMMLPGMKPRAHIYNPTKYTKWKSILSERLAYSNIQKDNYNSIDLVVGLPLMKSHRKVDKIAWMDQLHHKKPDVDNFAKGVFDAIQQSGKIGDDSILGSALIEKVWIAEKEDPFILFNLKKVINPRINFRSILLNSKKL